MFYYLIAGNLLMLGVFVLKCGTLPPQIPLFYSRLWGEDQLADTWMIIMLPFFLNVFYAFNGYFYNKYFPENNFVKKILDYLNLFLIVAFTLIFIRIILLIA